VLVIIAKKKGIIWQHLCWPVIWMA
jgi:hypothetical protein